MLLVFLGCFYCTGLSQWLQVYSSSCCCQKQRASLWRRLTRSSAPRGTSWPVESDHDRQTSRIVYSPSLPRPAGFTTVKNAAASLAGGQLRRSTRGCSVRLTADRWTWYDCSDSLQCACTAILNNRSTLACVSAHQAVRLHPRQSHVTSIERKTKVTLYYCITFCFMVLI